MRAWYHNKMYSLVIAISMSLNDHYTVILVTHMAADAEILHPLCKMTCIKDSHGHGVFLRLESITHPNLNQLPDLSEPLVFLQL